MMMAGICPSMFVPDSGGLCHGCQWCVILMERVVAGVSKDEENVVSMLTQSPPPPFVFIPANTVSAAEPLDITNLSSAFCYQRYH